MEARTLIINPDIAENRQLSQFLAMRTSRECLAFPNDREAIEWLKSTEEEVDLIFVYGEIFRGNQGFVEELRSIENSRFATLILILSPQDKEWLNLMSTTSEVIDNLLIKPFRVKELIEKVRRSLKANHIKRPSVLIVEKEKEDLELLRESLSVLGFANIYEARDGNAAFEMISQLASEVAVVVCDWEVEGMNGVQLLKKVRHTPKLMELPFLIVASQNSIEHLKAIHAVEVEISGFIAKPLEGNLFISEMEQLLPLIEKQHKVGRFLKETRVFEARGVVNHAIDLLNHAIKTLPDTAAIYEALGDVYRVAAETGGHKDLLVESANAYQKALKLEPLRSSLVCKCIDVLTDLGQLKDVIRITKAYLFKFGFDDQLRTRLGKIYLQNGDYGAACVELRRAISVNPLNEEAQSLLQVATDLQLKGSSRAA